jgi:uncharacterized protein involved in propanediol utilization
VTGPLTRPAGRGRRSHPLSRLTGWFVRRKTLPQVADGWSSGRCIGHHGEILQGAFEIGQTSATRALVTLPFPDAVSVAYARLDRAIDGVQVHPADRVKAARAAQLTLDQLGRSVGCQLRLQSTIPTGWGLGSSTADVVAAIKAVGRAAGHRLSPAEVAGLAVAAESASDSTMFAGQVILFAHREGKVLQVLGEALPDLVVIGCNIGSADGVDTLRHPPADYSVEELAVHAGLLDELRTALQQRNVA